jgi:colicin import membrane protein
MTTLAQPMSYAPPQPGLSLPSWVLAVLAHLLLLVALAWGVNWNRQAQELSVQAELWSAVPEQEAPKPEPVPARPPPPVVKVVPPVPQPRVADAQIALERDKRREARRKLEEEQARRQEQQKRELALQKEKEKALQARQKLDDEKEARRLQAEREANIRRMLAQAGAGASPSPNAAGAQARSAGPSASYAGRIRARIKPNIVFSDDAPGNPVAEVELRIAPDGTIVGQKLLKPSGVKAWDEAVLRAIEKTETLPRDVDGQIPSSMVIVFRPKE